MRETRPSESLDQRRPHSVGASHSMSRIGTRRCSRQLGILMGGIKSEPLRDLWAKVKLPEGCWDWLGSLHTDGYGKMGAKGANTTVYAHRLSYETFVGPIPAGYTIDHLCRNRKCCNPDHLEAVTIGENVLRGEGPVAKNKRKRVCAHGHPFSPDNTRVYTKPSGLQTRRCVICQKAAQLRQKERVAAMKTSGGS